MSELGSPYGGPADAGGAVDAEGTVDTAREQAAHVAESAADEAQHVAEVAKEQAAGVADEAKTQAKDLFRQAQDELREQAAQQQERVASGLQSVGDELSQMARASESQGVASDLVRQAADRANGIAAWLGQRDPGSLLSEVKSYARRNPGTFIAAAAVAGVLAGRLTRSLSSGAPEPGSTSSGPSEPGTPAGEHRAPDTGNPLDGGAERAPMRAPTARIVPATGTDPVVELGYGEQPGQRP